MTDALVIAPSAGGNRLVLHPPVDPYGDGYFRDFRIQASSEGLDAETYVLVLGTSDLVDFVSSLAEATRTAVTTPLEGRQKRGPSRYP